MDSLRTFEPDFQLQHMAGILYNIAPFVRHWLLLNLLFGSFQTDAWLQRYGHYKLLGVYGGFEMKPALCMFAKLVQTLGQFRPNLFCKYCANFDS
jgi:hypothetical protein